MDKEEKKAPPRVYRLNGQEILVEEHFAEGPSAADILRAYLLALRNEESMPPAREERE